MKARPASGFTTPTKRERQDGSAACVVNIANIIPTTSGIAASAAQGLSFKTEGLAYDDETTMFC